MQFEKLPDIAEYHGNMTIEKLKKVIKSRNFAAATGLICLIVVGGIYVYAYTRKQNNGYETPPKKPTVQNIKQPITTIPQSPQPVVTTPVISPHLFFDPLNGSDRLVTNEFVHWSPNDGCPYTSSTWDMTSGTLLIKNGAGYSGIPTVEHTSVCNSEIHNNSAIFRLNTKDLSFKNVSISMDYMAVQHGGGGAPNNSYDGIHIWLGYQTEYALYIATVYRWDNTIVLKKKVPVAQAQCASPANEGCYYNLAKEVIRKDLTTANVWHHAVVTTQAISNNSQHITLTIDNIKLIDAIDNDVHGATYPTGGVGVRGDNTEFYFKNYTVDSL